jgi:hypothetical protein
MWELGADGTLGFRHMIQISLQAMSGEVYINPSPNMETKPQLVSMKKSWKYGLYIRQSQILIILGKR